MSMLLDLGYWGWFIAGLLLMGLEILAPGAFMLWLGLAAIATGFVTALVDLSWQQTVIVFAALSLVSVLVGRRMLGDNLPGRANHPVAVQVRHGAPRPGPGARPRA